MSPNSLTPCERAQPVDGSKTRDELSFSTGEEAAHRYPLWSPEDIAEPEHWALASFGDLLVDEMT
jgi:hypothetical protein